MQPELEILQRVAQLAHEGIGRAAVAESAWWGTVHVHVVGSGQLGQGAQGDGSTLCGTGGEDRDGPVHGDVHAWGCAAAGAPGVSGRKYGGDVRLRRYLTGIFDDRDRVRLLVVVCLFILVPPPFEGSVSTHTHTFL